MKRIDTYIQEKLHINKNVKLVYNPDDLNNIEIVLYSDYSDEEGPYFITGGMYLAANVSLEQLKGIVPQIIPEGFELVSDWAESQFTDGTPFEGCAYLCGETVLEFAVYADVYQDGEDSLDVSVLQVASYSIA